MGRREYAFVAEQRGVGIVGLPPENVGAEPGDPVCCESGFQRVAVDVAATRLVDEKRILLHGRKGLA